MNVMQLFGSFVAIMLIAYLARRLFPVTQKINPERVRRNIKRYCPEFTEEEVDSAYIVISECGLSALAKLDDEGGIVLLRQIGDRIVVRYFADKTNLQISEEHGNLNINTHDFTMPPLSLKLDTDSASELMQKIDKMNPATETRAPEEAHA